MSIHNFLNKKTAFWSAALALSVRAFASPAEGWVFESQPWQTKGVKIGNDSSTAKRSEIGVIVTLRNSHYSMAMSDENYQTFAALIDNNYVSISVKYSRMGRKTPNKEANKPPIGVLHLIHLLDGICLNC